MYFSETRSSVTDFCKQNKMTHVCCSFKLLVWWTVFRTRRDRSQSIEIVPLLSSSKNKTRHKAHWQFQDMKSQAKLTWFLRVLQCLACHKMLISWRFAHPIVPSLVLVGQGEQRDAGSLQKFLYLAIESLTSFFNHRGSVKYLYQMGTVVISFFPEYCSHVVYQRCRGCCNANVKQMYVSLKQNKNNKKASKQNVFHYFVQTFIGLLETYIYSRVTFRVTQLFTF